MEKIILASASPRRKEILEAAGIPFEVKIANVAEWEPTRDACPKDIVCHNAELKALAVSRLYPSCLVLGADTTVALGNEIFHKPSNAGEAKMMLRKLSGVEHTVYTGVCFARDGIVKTNEAVASAVVFKLLNDDLIEQYISESHPYDKAGGYGIQDVSSKRIIACYRGSLSNIIGLPIERVKTILESISL